MEELIQRIKRHEGLRLSPYRDSQGNLTIGYGHNLDAKPISIRAAQVILEDDLRDGWMGLQFVPHEYWQHLNTRRKEVLVEMIFNMGVKGLMSFKRMLNALARADYEEAAREMLDSRWARQVGSRAEELAEIMRKG